VGWGEYDVFDSCHLFTTCFYPYRDVGLTFVACVF